MRIDIDLQFKKKSWKILLIDAEKPSATLLRRNANKKIPKTF